MLVMVGVFFAQNFDIWRAPSCVRCNVDVRLSPTEFDDVTSSLKESGIAVETWISDVQSLLDTQKMGLGAAVNDTLFDYSRYHRIEEVITVHRYIAV